MRIVAEIRQDWQVPILNESDVKTGLLVSHEWRSTIHSGMLSRAGVSERPVVVKVFNRQTAKKVVDDATRIERLYQYYKRECGLWRKIGSHQNVVQILGVIESYHGSVFPAIVMPFYSHRDLRSFVEVKPETPVNTRAKLMYDVAQGLLYLHTMSPPLVHRDIKGSNILVHDDGRSLVAKISDFGSAKFSFASEYDISSTTRGAVLDWTSPELAEEKPEEKTGYSTPTCASDMWSFACTFLEVLTARNPWGAVGCSRALLSKGVHPDRPLDINFDNVYWSLMRKCWRLTPEDRLSSEDVTIFMRSLRLAPL